MLKLFFTEWITFNVLNLTNEAAAVIKRWEITLNYMAGLPSSADNNGVF